MIKEKIKGLTSKIIMPLTVAGGIMAGIISNQESAQAQDFRIPLGLDFLINNPALPISHNDRHFLNYINRINYLTALRNSQEQVHVFHHYELDRIDGREDGRIDPNYIPQPIISNYWLDSNKDGCGQLNENIGLNKTKFKSHEQFHYRIHCGGQKLTGSSYEIDLYSPKGKNIYSHNNGERSFIDGKKNPGGFLNLETLLDKYGEGRYAVVFSLNGQHWDTRQFELSEGKNSKNSPQTFIANSWQDFDRDDHVNFPSEFPGIGKTRFNEDESILIGLRFPLDRRVADKKFETRLYKVLANKDKKLVNRHESIMSHDNAWENFRDGKIAKNNGTGNYEVEFYFDNRHLNTIPFEIVSDNPLENVKVIVEPLGVFEKNAPIE